MKATGEQMLQFIGGKASRRTCTQVLETSLWSDEEQKEGSNVHYTCPTKTNHNFLLWRGTGSGGSFLYSFY